MTGKWARITVFEGYVDKRIHSLFMFNILNLYLENLRNWICILRSFRNLSAIFRVILIESVAKICWNDGKHNFFARHIGFIGHFCIFQQFFV
jgi:hypothetical protein